MRWKIFGLIVKMICAVTHVQESNEGRNGVFSLNSENFENFLNDFPTALVLFYYSARCPNCANIEEQFDKMATQRSIGFGKVDISKEFDIAEKFNIKEISTMVWMWNNGDGPIPYDDLYADAESVLEWIDSQLDPNFVLPPDEIVHLNSTNFESFVRTNELVLVDFYVNECDRCASFAVHLSKASRKLKSYGIKIGMMNLDDEEDILLRYNIREYPSTKIFRYGKMMPYTGFRYSAGVVTYMVNLLYHPAKRLFNLTDIRANIRPDEYSIIGFFDEEEGFFYETFLSVAILMRNKFNSIGYTIDETAKKAYGAKDGTILLFFPSNFTNSHEEVYATYYDEYVTVDDVIQFVTEHTNPLVGIRTYRNEDFFRSKYPLIVVYYATDWSPRGFKHSQIFREKVTAIAEKYKSEYNFAISNKDDFMADLYEVCLEDSNADHNVILFLSRSKMYAMDPAIYNKDLTSNLEAFIESLKYGLPNKLERTKKVLLPILPQPAVRVLTPDSFDWIVNRVNTDAIIFFHSDNCSKCREFAPYYHELAENVTELTTYAQFTTYNLTAYPPPEDWKIKKIPSFYVVSTGEDSMKMGFSENLNDESFRRFLRLACLKTFQDVRHRKFDARKSIIAKILLANKRKEEL